MSDKTAFERLVDFLSVWDTRKTSSSQTTTSETSTASKKTTTSEKTTPSEKTAPPESQRLPSTQRNDLFELGLQIHKECVVQGTDYNVEIKRMWLQYAILMGVDKPDGESPFLREFFNNYVHECQYIDQGSYGVVYQPKSNGKSVVKFGAMGENYLDLVTLQYIQPLIESGFVPGIQLLDACVMIVCALGDDNDDDDYWTEFRKLTPVFCKQLQIVWEYLVQNMKHDIWGSKYGLQLINGVNEHIMVFGFSAMTKIDAVIYSHQEEKEHQLSTPIRYRDSNFNHVIKFEALPERVLFEYFHFHYMTWKYLGIEAWSDNKTDNMGLVYSADPVEYVLEGRVYRFEKGASFRRIDFGGNAWLMGKNNRVTEQLGDKPIKLITPRQMIEKSRESRDMIIPFGFSYLPHVPILTKSLQRLTQWTLNSYHFHSNARCRKFFGLEYQTNSWKDWIKLIRVQFNAFEVSDQNAVKSTLAKFSEWETNMLESDSSVDGEGYQFSGVDRETMDKTAKKVKVKRSKK